MRQTAKRCGRWLAVLLVLGILIGCRWVFPRRDRVAGEAGTVTTAQSVTEAQGRNQCGGCSAAYLLRADGKDITGAEAYAEIPLKLPNGYLLPQGIRSYLRQEGYPAVMRRGTPDQLCARLREGLPVIALIQEGPERYRLLLFIYNRTGEDEKNAPYSRTLYRAGKSFRRLSSGSRPGSDAADGVQH